MKGFLGDVYFVNELYVIVFDIVVDYFDVVVSIFVINLFVVGFVVVFGGDGLEDVFDVRLGFFVVIGYEGRVVVGIFFIIRDIGVNEVEVFVVEILSVVVGVGEVRVVIINDDVVLGEEG